MLDISIRYCGLSNFVICFHCLTLLIMVEWMNFDEKLYTEFCGVEQSDRDRWALLTSTSPHDDVEINLKLKIVYELFFRAIHFCCSCQFPYNKATIMLEILQKELNYLCFSKQNLDPVSETVVDMNAAKSRYTNYVRTNYFYGLVSIGFV